TAAPVLSRLQRFDLRRIGPVDIIARLTEILGKEEVSANPEALAMIARAADGSMRDALSLTDQVISLGEGAVTPQAVRDALGLVPEDEFLSIIDLIADGRAGDVFTTAQRLADGGIDFGMFLAGLADMLRAQLAVTLGGQATDVSATASERLQANATKFAAGDLLRMLSALSDLEPKFRKSGQQQLLVELLLVRFALQDRTVTLEDVLQELARNPGSGGSSGSGGVPDWRAALHTEGPPTRATAPQRPSGGTLGAQRPTPEVRQEAGASGDAGGERGRVTGALRSRSSSDPTPLAASVAPEAAPRSPGPSASARPVDAMRQAMQAAQAAGEGGRMTDEQIKAERIAVMRQKDPVLGAAIDLLDLELMD
ncbi:MAG TPA: hypothetical protein VNU46_02295, partial [Gemmatimonadaceae bacterium]|nr:hypothetical protein [Gemmatimonadaceae bacterium]